MTPGERAVKAELKHLKLRFEQGKRIYNLKGDSKKFRDADFYLPDYNVYIEFLGNWDTSIADKERYKEKMRVFQLNGLKCIWVYPNQLTYTTKVIQEGLIKRGVNLDELKYDKPQPKINKTKQNQLINETEVKDIENRIKKKLKDIEKLIDINPSAHKKPSKIVIKWFLAIGLVIFILFIFGNINKNKVNNSQFDRSAININIPYKVTESAEVDGFCKGICGKSKIFEKNSIQSISIIRCYCEGQPTKYFDLRTKEILDINEVRNRNIYLNSLK